MMDNMKATDPASQGVKNGGSDVHLTPPEIVHSLLKLWPNGIELDPCSNEGQPNIPAQGRYTQETNGLAHEWNANTLFLNPPYSENKVWAKKFCDEWCFNRFSEAVVLNKNDNRVKSWYASYHDICDAFCLVRGGLKFSGASTVAPFPSILWYYGHRSLEFMVAFKEIGWCYRNFKESTSIG